LSLRILLELANHKGGDKCDGLAERNDAIIGAFGSDVCVELVDCFKAARRRREVAIRKEAGIAWKEVFDL
jgi:hypothetical protein